MAEGSLPLAPSDESVSHMQLTMTKERDEVAKIIKLEVEKLLKWGALTCGMTFFDSCANVSRSCLRVRNMRTSFLQDDGLENLKRIHWMFHKLPESLHKDVLMHQMSHMDVVTNKVMHQLNIVWGVKREGEEHPRRSNCIEKVHSRTLNEKKTTMINPQKTRNKRTPFVRHPASKARSGKPSAYKQGGTEFYWKSDAEGEQVVS